MLKKYMSEYFTLTEDAMDVPQNKRSEPIDIIERLKNKLGDDASKYVQISHRMTAYQDPGRIQVFSPSEQDGIYTLQFLRLRQATPPEIAKHDGKLEILKLDDGDFIAESASGLFDRKTKIFILQRNYFGANYSFISNYLNCLLYDIERKNIIHLVPQMDGKINLTSVFSHPIKSFTATVAFEGEQLDINSSVCSFSKFRPTTVDFSVRIKKGKHRKLHEQETKDEITRLSTEHSTKKLKVKYLNEDDKPLEVDLMKNRLCDNFVLNNVSKDNPATHADIYRELEKNYLSRVLSSQDVRFEMRRKNLNETQLR